MTSSNAVISTVIHRGRLAIHTALMHSFQREIGSGTLFTDLFKELAAGLNIAAPPNPYQQFVDNVLFRFNEALPVLSLVLAQPDGLEQVAGLLCTGADQTISAQFSESDLAQAQATSELIFAKLQDGLKEVEGDGLSDLGDELDVDIDTLAKEPERVRKVFPPHNIGLGHNEISDLENALGCSIDDRGDNDGIDQYAQTLLPTILQFAYAPQELRNNDFRSNSPLWKWAEVKKPSGHEHLSPDQATDLATTGVINLLIRMAKQNNRQEMFRYFMARHLRQEYGLGAGRGHEATPFSGFEQRRGTEEVEASGLPPWQPSDQQVLQAYEDADLRMMLEAIYNAAPPAQREAFELYYQAEISGRSLADLCRERGKDPNLVRNNFQALKNAVRKKAFQD